MLKHAKNVAMAIIAVCVGVAVDAAALEIQHNGRLCWICDSGQTICEWGNADIKLKCQSDQDADCTNYNNVTGEFTPVCTDRDSTTI